MPIMQTKRIFQLAREEGYGIGGFCAENMDMVRAILLAASETRSPVVVTLWEKDIAFAGEGSLESLVSLYASRLDIPVGIMLDHGTSLESCLGAVRTGHTGVMIDASLENLEINIARTREVCQAVHPLGVMVEGEIGMIRRSFETEGDYAGNSIYTEPDSVVEYTRKSEVDAVAVSVGNESGFTKKNLDFDRLSSIIRKANAYIVLHGGSCLPDEDLQRAVKCGVTAFRFASENRIAYMDAIEKVRESIPAKYPDTRLIYGKAVQAVKYLVSRRMIALGCSGKAKYFG